MNEIDKEMDIDLGLIDRMNISLVEKLQKANDIVKLYAEIKKKDKISGDELDRLRGKREEIMRIPEPKILPVVDKPKKVVKKKRKR